jgi:hypothetical protein
MTNTKTTSKRASQKGSFFDPKKEAKTTLNYIGLCLHDPMTSQAKENIKNYLENALNLAYKIGERDGYSEGHNEVIEAWKKSRELIFEK